MTTPSPTTPAGAPPPPVQTAAPQTVTLEGVVDALRPMFGAQAPNINTWETRCLVERLLNEKAGRGPLQGADATAKALLGRAIGGWDNPSVKSGALLRAACVILNVSPVPAATQPPAQTAAAPKWGNFPASLPGAAETSAAPTGDKTAKAAKKTAKAAKKTAKAAKKTAKKAAKRALLCGILAAVAAMTAVIAAASSGWAAVIAAVIATAAGITGATIGAKTFASTKPHPQPSHSQ